MNLSWRAVDCAIKRIQRCGVTRLVDTYVVPAVLPETVVGGHRARCGRSRVCGWLAAGVHVSVALVCITSTLGGWAASAETVLNAKTSWIGNTFGFGDGTWTQINITAIAVAPDGKVYTNAPWDESGAEASTYQNGKMLGFAGGTHGWGNGRRQCDCGESQVCVHGGIGRQ